MTIDESITYTLPVHALPALINDDITGLSDDDLSTIEHFTATELGTLRRNERLHFLSWEVKWDDGQSFSRFHDLEPYGWQSDTCLDVVAHFQQIG